MTLQEQVLAIMAKRNEEQAKLGKTPYSDLDFELVREWTDTQCESVLVGATEGMQAAMICLVLINQYTTHAEGIH